MHSARRLSVTRGCFRPPLKRSPIRGLRSRCFGMGDLRGAQRRARPGSPEWEACVPTDCRSRPSLLPRRGLAEYSDTTCSALFLSCSRVFLTFWPSGSLVLLLPIASMSLNTLRKKEKNLKETTGLRTRRRIAREPRPLPSFYVPRGTIYGGGDWILYFWLTSLFSSYSNETLS